LYINASFLEAICTGVLDDETVMKQRLPNPAFPKSRLQMAAEYNMHVKSFMRKLSQVGIILPHGRIMPDDQLRIYLALGSPIFVWIDQDTRVRYEDDNE